VADSAKVKIIIPIVSGLDLRKIVKPVSRIIIVIVVIIIYILWNCTKHNIKFMRLISMYILVINVGIAPIL
jgi:hypothetical protein